jgi:uncharacterized membrane protein YtjA (UPF0391 family)
MLTWSVIFFISAAIAGFYIYGSSESFISKACKTFFFIFITLSALAVIYSFLPDQDEVLHRREFFKISKG